MNDSDLVIEHLNSFNTVISHLLSIDIKITEEEKCISILCSLPNSWDTLVMAIGSNNTTLKINDVVAELLLEEMRRKTMEGSILKALSVRGISISRKKAKPFNGRTKSRENRGRGQHPRVCR